jgi:hypothetical protein
VKNKRFTYFLGVVVLALWGLIIYKIIKWVHEANDDTVQTVAGKITKEPYNDFAITADTTHLLLNYRDPFGLIKPKDTVNASIKRNYHKNISLLKQPVFNWDFIQYSGYIRNPASKKLITLVNIGGKSEMLSEGETKDQVKLIKNMRDSIKISFNGKTKFITRRPASL